MLVGACPVGSLVHLHLHRRDREDHGTPVECASTWLCTMSASQAGDPGGDACPTPGRRVAPTGRRGAGPVRVRPHMLLGVRTDG